AHDVQPQIQSQLGGFFGGMVRAYLPQTWVFKTEREEASLVVDTAGAVSVTKGAALHPDVTIEVDHERLVTALRTRSRDQVPPGRLTVTPHTSKGKTAFEYLRGRIGL
ncbi:MAG TPA: hypothetical protein VK423_05205, partial [Thermoplasmata archaeon]|nr:hypothetical protein [Thermoplasmata archaeon]